MATPLAWRAILPRRDPNREGQAQLPKVASEAFQSPDGELTLTSQLSHELVQRVVDGLQTWETATNGRGQLGAVCGGFR